jgi:hypothetical protein
MKQYSPEHRFMKPLPSGEIKDANTKEKDFVFEMTESRAA